MILINGIMPTITEFPNHETTINIPGNALSGDNVVIEWLFENDSEIMTINQIRSVLNEYRIHRPTCVIPYLPYERMDRFEGHNPVSLNALVCCLPINWNYVVIEPHSSRVVEAFRDAQLSVDVRLFNHLGNADIPVHVLPDKGAFKRYTSDNPTTLEEIKTAIKHGKIYLIGRKTRDFDTHKITGYTVDQQLTINGDGRFEIVPWDKNAVVRALETSYNNIVMVHDDIASYGNTFIKLAEALRTQMPGIDLTMQLTVAHAEQSIYKGDLLNHFHRIFTTNSLLFGSQFANHATQTVDVTNVRDLYHDLLPSIIR